MLNFERKEEGMGKVERMFLMMAVAAVAYLHVVYTFIR